jgi:chromosome partitioning protein
VKIGVMQGHLSEFDLAAVLQVVGLGRQYTGVEVQHDDGRAGTIFVKSGVVVSVHAPPHEGKQAFFEMFGDTAGRFFVFRTETPLSLPEPLGPMHHLLMEAASSPPPPSRPQRRPSSPEITVAVASDAPPPPNPSVLPFADMEVATNAAMSVAGSLPREARASSAPPLKSLRPPINAEPPPPAQPPLGTNLPPAARVNNTVNANAHARPKPVVPQASGGDGRIIAVASPKGGCGKTTVALNAAIALARQGHPVTLVDADINGDILSAINSRGRAQVGTFDILEGRAKVEQGLLPTIVPHFKILPAVGTRLPDARTLASDLGGRFRELLRTLAKDSNVIVDTPAGMYGITRHVLTSSTHVVAVLQAETVAHRSFERFREGIASIPEAERPRVLGVVLNMLQMRHGASLSVLQSVCVDLPPDWLFETSIPRHPAILDATAQGVPLRHLDENAPPAVAFLFDTLAAEVAQRLRLSVNEFKPQPLLL